MIAYQAPTVEAFLRDVIGMGHGSPRSPVDEVHEDVVARIWREHPDLITQPTAAASADSMLRDFAGALPATAMIADLRRPQLGQGFAWGRYGPQTSIERFGAERLWALTPPLQKPGLFARLFGR